MGQTVSGSTSPPLTNNKRPQYRRPWQRSQQSHSAFTTHASSHRQFLYRQSKSQEQKSSPQQQSEPEKVKLIFKQIHHNGTITKLCFREGIKYRHIGKDASGNDKYTCVAGAGVPACRCYTYIVYKGGDAYDYDYSGPHSDVGHDLYDDIDIGLIDFKEEVKRRIKGGLSPHEAYYAVGRDYPEVAEVAVQGWESIRNIAYNAQQHSRGILPSQKKDIKAYLEDNNLAGNYYDQLLNGKNYDPDTTTPEMLARWEERRGSFYLGDGDTNGRFQIWCPRWGAEQLRDGIRHYVDVTYKTAPRIAGMVIPYKGVLHFLSGHENKNIDFVPHTTPSATILFQVAHPTQEEYDKGIKLLVRLCDEIYGIDIVNTSMRLVLYSMGDMERPLRGALKLNWPAGVKKICAFHYSKGLNTNLGKKKLNTYYRSSGKGYQPTIYYYFRNFHGMLAAPPLLVRRCWNLIKSRRKTAYYAVCKQQGNTWLKYHKSEYMSSLELIREWNHYRCYVRTNNQLENRNGRVNMAFGAHPFMGKFAFELAKWYQDEYIQLQQFLNQGYQRRRTNKEVLKNELLTRCWDFIDENQRDEDLIIFMKYASIALKGNKDLIQKILKRDCFWKKE